MHFFKSERRPIAGRKAVSLIVASMVFSGFSSLGIAASCCGGGNASTLILPKGAKKMIDGSLDIERYDGFWNLDGDHVDDPAGANLSQYRLNLGYAHRLTDNWQVSAILPYVINNNEYPGINGNNSAFGDAAISLWYEAFDAITCVWQVNSWEDLKPSIYIGSSLTLPTGDSAYSDRADNSFEVTGRGFYRLDGNIIIEKTVYPWTVTTQASYGVNFERPINEEFGNPVEPYDKKLGDRRFLNASLGYTHFFDDMDALTVTTGISDLRESKGEINGNSDPLSAMKKRSVSLAAAYETPEKDWIIKMSWSHAPKRNGWGKSFPTTDIFTLGVSHVIR